LNRDNFLPYDEPPRKLKFSLFLPSTIICCLFIAFLLSIIAYHHITFKRKQKSPNEDTLLRDAANVHEEKNIDI
jgi:hypothetical protein